VVTPHLLDELAAVLSRPKFRRWVTTADALAFVEALSRKAELQPDSAILTEASRDPGDDYLVEAARTAAAVLVTGDKDLLELDLEPPVRTPREFLELLRNPRET
jgi:putative PIN family toxin of toxin-antitoxin system